MSIVEQKVRYELYHQIKEAKYLCESLEAIGGLDNAVASLRAAIRELEKPESRAIMEVHLGRALLKSEAIHHINGDQRDNRVENLEVVSVNR